MLFFYFQFFSYFFFLKIFLFKKDQVSLTDRRSKDSSDTISVDIPLIPSPLKATYHRRTMSDDGKLKYSSGSSDVPSCTELNSSGDDDIDEDELFPEDDFSARVRPGTPPYEMNDFTWQAKRANQFAKDWALIEEWAQDLSTNVKIGNENLKGEVKKALIRLKKESQKPFIIIGNDLKKFNDKLINRQKGKAKGDIFMDLSETQDSISIPNTPRNGLFLYSLFLYSLFLSSLSLFSFFKFLSFL